MKDENQHARITFHDFVYQVDKNTKELWVNDGYAEFGAYLLTQFGLTDWTVEELPF